MPLFVYKARDSTGSIVNGDVEAADSWLARKAVTKLDLAVIEIKRRDLLFRAMGALSRLRALSDRVSLEERLVFISQLEIGISVGIPVLNVLELAIQDIRHKAFREAIRAVIGQVTQGSSLHESFARHPEFFDETFVGLIRTGEQSGEIDKVLGRLFKIVEQEAENKARIKSAMFYPKIVVFFLILVSVSVVTFVIPRIKGFLGSFGQDLPLVTRFVVGISDLFTRYGVLTLPLIGAGAYYLDKLSRTPKGAMMLDRWKLKAPMLGPLFLQLEVCSFCVVLELLLESGIPLTEALITTARSQSNRVVREEIERIRQDVTSGSSLRRSMGAGSVFPSSVSSLISIGEDSGRIPDVLKRIGRHYQLQVDYRLANLPKLIEPVLLAVIFVFTLVLALAVFLPIWKMSSALKSQ